MIEVFKTDIDQPLVAQQIVDEIRALPLGVDASFDLEDCDHILRVCGDFEPISLKDQMIALLLSKGYVAIPLDDDDGFSVYQLEEQLLGTQTGIIAFLNIR